MLEETVNFMSQKPTAIVSAGAYLGQPYFIVNDVNLVRVHFHG